MSLRKLVAAFALVSATLPSVLAAPDTELELAFCSAIASYPASDRERGGYDIEIAELIANDLGGTATFIWTNFDDIGMRDTLHSGLCDIVIGVTESVSNVITTVPYLNAPYAFVTRAESDLRIGSLDDPQLRDLRIGTYQAGLPSIALRNRGIVDNVVEYAAIVRRTGVDAHTPILDGLVDGEVDVAIVYGPVAAAAAREAAVALDVSAVTPEIDVGARLLPLTRVLTIGVRSHDEALRDRLNRVMARRWGEIEAILDAYGIPRFPVAPPLDRAELAVSAKVGVILPAATPAALPNATVGDDALRGATVANSFVPDLPETVQILKAHAPTLEASLRAATRLVAVEGVSALVGGYSAEEAELLARLAARYDVPFFNVGSEADALRDSRCYPTTFHVAPSASMMLAATVAGIAGVAEDLALVIEDEPTSERLEHLEAVVSAVGGRMVRSFAVAPGQFVYYPLLQELAASGPQTVLLLMSSEAQELLLSQAAALMPTADLLGVSSLAGQSRPFLHRFLQVAPQLATRPRVVAWDPALDVGLNDTFMSRTGEPLEPIAWSTFAGIMTAFEATAAGELASSESLRAFLTDPQRELAIGKGPSARFRAEDGQLLQDLYVIEVDPDATWGRTAAARTAVARPLQTIPADVTAGLYGTAAGCAAP